MTRRVETPVEAGRTYWRSYAELADDPEFRAFAEAEFPEKAPEGIPRRQMLMLLGASLSLAGIAGCRRPVEHIVPYVESPEQVIPGVPRHYATTMPFGNSAYGVLVESHEGRPTKIEGNPDHPSTLGASSLWMQSALLDLYDPDRSRRPRYQGEPAEWSEFVTAWQGLEATLLESGGQGLAILSEPHGSPTLARLAAAIRARFPAARWIAREPLGDDNEREGLRMATGQSLRALHDLAGAKRILSLESDFLQSDPEMVRHTRGFAAGRRAGAEGGTMSRLYVVESAYSVTGANADHRLPVKSSAVAGVLAAVAAELSIGGASGAAPAGVDPKWIATVARDLREHRGESLVLAGPSQPPEVHAAVATLNAALGNVGRTVRYVAPRDEARSDGAAFAALVEAMAAGEVTTLVMLGGNPLYDAPADLDFASALTAVGTSIHLSVGRNETSRAATWHLPRAHWLEAWGDARSADGTAGVIQPLIQPLFDGKSDVELAGLIATGEDRPGYDLVRETWQGILGAADFERSWSRVLHDGLHRAAPAPAESTAVASALPAGLGRGAGDGIEVVFRGGPGVHDGRFANNGWLQELPDTMTKLTWDNAALMAPATARALGVGNDDVVRIERDGRGIELPVWVVPGQAADTVVVWLGYGRTAAGRVGNGIGVDAYALRGSSAPWFAAGATVTATGATYALASTQDHGSMQGEHDKQPRPVVREATVDRYRQDPGFAAKMVEHPPLKQIIGDHDYSTGYQWGMAIDLNACTGCNACIVACQSENNIPVVGKQPVIDGREMHWLRVDRYFVSEGKRPEDDPAPRAVFQPMPCMHCENAPCEQVCPVAATVHDSEGLNVMVYNRCIGTRYCSNNCPYKVRRFNFYNYTKDTPELMKLAQNPDVTVRSRGVMEKCTYCTQRIQAGKIRARLEGRELRDGDVRTACQQACPANAIAFGNILDADSEVARAKGQERDYTLLAELNNRPRTTFLAGLTNPHPDLAPPAPAAPAGGDHGEDH